MAKKSFVDLLKEKGYEVTEKRLGEGFVNDVRLITAHKGDQVIEYVSKKYKNEKDMQDMFRGYDLISSVIKTPTIVYHSGTEVVYDLVKGKSLKDMIVNRDPNASEAVRLLGKELEKLHQSKNAPPRYRGGDSPDERKMIKDVVKALGKEQISRIDANRLVRRIKEYIPRNKSIIHGDAHLGNFMYSESEQALYFIDPDCVQISDYNADLGKVVFAIEQLEGEGRISANQASQLSNLFLAEYNGEDQQAVKLYKARTPLIMMKHRPLDVARRVFSRMGLEARVASIAIMLIALISLSWITKFNPVGLAIGGVKNSGSWLTAGVLIIILLIACLILKRIKKKTN